MSNCTTQQTAEKMITIIQELAETLTIAKSMILDFEAGYSVDELCEHPTDFLDRYRTVFAKINEAEA